MSKRLKIYIVSRILIATSISLLVFLGFCQSFGLGVIQIKSIYTLDTGVVPISVALEFVLALTTVFLFYLGYRLYGKAPKKEGKALGLETSKETSLKFIVAVLLGTVSAWFIYKEFSDANIWSYHIPDFVKIAKDSVALQISATITLLLLLIWFLGIKIRIRYQ